MKRWQPGTLDYIAADDMRDGAADVDYFRKRREQDEAHLRWVHFSSRADWLHRSASQLLLEESIIGGPPRWAVIKARRYARAAVRVEEWAREARSKSHGR